MRARWARGVRRSAGRGTWYHGHGVGHSILMADADLLPMSQAGAMAHFRHALRFKLADRVAAGGTLDPLRPDDVAYDPLAARNAHDARPCESHGAGRAQSMGHAHLRGAPASGAGVGEGFCRHRVADGPPRAAQHPRRSLRDLRRPSAHVCERSGAAPNLRTRAGQMSHASAARVMDRSPVNLPYDVSCDPPTNLDAPDAAARHILQLRCGHLPNDQR